MNIALVYMNTEPNVGRGAGYIAGAVMQAGYGLSFFDTAYTSPAQIARRIVAGRYDVLLISTMTLVFPAALKLIRYVKQHCAMTTVLVGGIHPTIIGESLLREHHEIDYLCIGEGETMVAEFLQCLGSESLYRVNNLAYRRGNRVYANRLNPPQDLAALPEFPWQTFPGQSVIQPPAGFLYVTATRGCPYNCTYCCNGIYLHHYGKGYLRFRPVEQVIDELKYLKAEYNPNLLYFGDEMIMADADYAVKLFKTVKEQIDAPYGIMIRVEHATPEAARILRETGCQYVGMGIECGDEKFRRKYLHRFMSNDQIIDGFRNLIEAGIFTTSFNMIGFPFANDADRIRSTVDLNRQINPGYAQITIFHPFPGTSLYDHCVNNDLIDWHRMCAKERYYEESVLKGYVLQNTRVNIERFLNPRGFQFKPSIPKPVLPRGLRMTLKKPGRLALQPH